MFMHWVFHSFNWSHHDVHIWYVLHLIIDSLVITIIYDYNTGCGSGLPPRQTQAFKVLVACTLAGIIVNTIVYSSAT